MDRQTLTRQRDQEGGRVIRWFESENTIASLVDGDYGEERELRISHKTHDFQSFKVRGWWFDVPDKILVDEIISLIEREVMK